MLPHRGRPAAARSETAERSPNALQRDRFYTEVMRRHEAMRQAAVVAIGFKRLDALVDGEVIAQAAKEHRVLLTGDKDFGWYAFVKGVDAGVILIRFPGEARQALPATVTELAREQGSRLTGSFAVVEPGRVRMTPRPVVGGV